GPSRGSRAQHPPAAAGCRAQGGPQDIIGHRRGDRPTGRARAAPLIATRLAVVDQAAFAVCCTWPWLISVPSTLRHSRMNAASPVQPLAETIVPSTKASVGATSI